MSSVSTVAVRSSGRAASSSLPVDQSLRTALSDFQKTLNPDQKQRFLSQSSTPDASSAIILTAEIDNENAKRRSRCVAARILSFLESVQQFCSVVDILVSSNPKIAALVWGSVKFVILAASNFSTYFDKLSTLLMNLRNYFPRYSKYQILYFQSTRLQEALCSYYATVVDLCKKVLEVSQRSGFLHAASSLLKPFEVEFGDVRSQLEKQNLEIEQELDLAEREAAVQERQLQDLERKSAQSNRHLGSLFRKKIESESDEAHDWRQQIGKHKSGKERQTLLEKLSSHDFKRAYRKACRRRHGTTGSWIQRRAELGKWVCSRGSSIFWCSGIPGSGKTVLTAGIIGELFLRIPANISGVRFFFCEYDRPESLKAATILCSLIRQCLDVDNMSEKIETRLESVVQDTSDLENLGDILVDIFAESPRQCIVVDAIDECDKQEQRALLTTLRRVLNPPHARSKLFLASGPHISAELNRVLDINYHLSLTSSEVDSDIRTYIESILAEKIESGELAIGEPLLMNDIQDALVKGAKGMFLWVAFQIQDICSQKCDEDIRGVIKDLPIGLSETYERALYKINSEKGAAKWAQKIFRWVAATKQHLTLQELREAIAITPGQPCRKPAALINDIHQLVPCCRNLVILDEEENVVQFAHHTIKRFLLGDSTDASLEGFHFLLPQANYEIGEVCVTYLNFADLKQQVAKHPLSNNASIDMSKMLSVSLSGALSISMTSRWLKWLQWAKANGREADLTRLLLPSANLTEKLNSVYALLPYASKYWLFHSSEFTKADTRSWRLWDKILTSEVNFGQVPWTDEEWSIGDQKVIQCIVEHEHFALLERFIGSTTLDTQPYLAKLLNLAAERGLIVFVRFLSNSWDFPSSDLFLALQSAAGHSHLEIVDILLRKIATIDSAVHSDIACASLAIAAGVGNLEVTKKLLDAGFTPNAGGDTHMDQTPLLAAVQTGDYNMVDLILDAGANVAGDAGQACLLEATEHGYLEILDRLLKQASLGVCGFGYVYTAFRLATKCDHPEIVDRFLERIRFDIFTIRDLMIAAIQDSQLEVLDRLLKVKVNGKEVTPSYSVLEKAIQCGSIELVDRLINVETNANVASPRGHTILRTAVVHDDLEIVDRVLRARPGVWFHQHDDHVALQIAAARGNLGIVGSLLKAGVRVNDDPHSGCQALLGAAENGRVRVVYRFLNGKPGVNCGHGSIALQKAIEYGHLEVAEILLKAGARPNFMPDNTKTLVRAASKAGCLEIVKSLKPAPIIK